MNVSIFVLYYVLLLYKNYLLSNRTDNSVAFYLELNIDKLSNIYSYMFYSKYILMMWIMKILVTGGTSYIVSHTVVELLNNN